MHMIREHPEYTWAIGNEAYYFMLALEKLQDMLEHEHIGWFFDEECNVIQGRFNEAHLKNMAEFVRNALDDLKKNFDNKHTYNVWMGYFEI